MAINAMIMNQLLKDPNGIYSNGIAASLEEVELAIEAERKGRNRKEVINKLALVRNVKAAGGIPKRPPRQLYSF